MSAGDIVFLCLAVMATGILLFLFRRLAPAPLERDHNDVAGIIFATVGALYAVLLAFVVVSVWENIGKAQDTALQEANSVASIYWLSRQLPLDQGRPLERLTLQYAHTVIDQEWPETAHGQADQAATQLVYEIRDQAFEMNPVNLREQVLFTEATTYVNNLADTRRERLNFLSGAVPPFLWICLIGGGAITILFTYLFEFSNIKGHILLVSLLTLLITLALLVVKEMDYPFTGNGHLQPDALKVFLARLPPPR